MSEKNHVSQTSLTRSMGMVEATTVSIGLVVGVGIFTVGSQCAGTMPGGAIIIATTIALILSIYPCLMYAEMGAALPFAGGTYNFARRAVNKPVASIAAWQYLISFVSCAAGESLAFANYFSWIFKALGVNFTVDPRILAFLLMFFFSFINYRGIEISSRVQNGFVFFFWGATLVWMIYMFKNGDAANFIFPNADTIPEVKTFMTAVILVWWCFSGFETSLGMAGEVKYPKINIPRSMVIIPFLLFAINGLFQWFLTALVPFASQPQLATMDAPFAEGLSVAGYVGFPILLLCIAIAFGGDMSTMNPCITAPSRYMFAMSCDGVMPKALSKLHPKYNTPYIAVIVTGVLILALILTNSIGLVAIISASSMFWNYCIGYISFWMLRKREPDLERPFKVKGATFGVIFSLITYITMFCFCGFREALCSCGVAAVCLLYYFIWGKNHMTSDEETKAEIDAANALLEGDVPSAEEKAKMDKTYHAWLGVSIVLDIVVVALFVIYWAM